MQAHSTSHLIPIALDACADARASESAGTQAVSSESAGVHAGSGENARFSGVLERVRQMAEQIAAREGCSLYDIELVGAGIGRVLRVYVDREGGSSIEDCSRVSRGLNLLLDVEDVIPGGAYSLEVSTPGLERVLRMPWHFSRVIGQAIAVKSFAPLLDFNPSLVALGKARQLTGILAALGETGIQVEWAGPSGDAQVFVPFSAIAKAHVVFKFDEGSARPLGAQELVKKPNRTPKKTPKKTKEKHKK
jgi:ribosome maturation factor RimP